MENYWDSYGSMTAGALCPNRIIERLVIATDKLEIIARMNCKTNLNVNGYGYR